MNDPMSPFTTCDFPLRPLRIPEGWRLGYNDFCEVPFDHPQAWRYAFKESLLMLTHERRGMLVDLGWYPDQDAALNAVQADVLLGELDFVGGLLAADAALASLLNGLAPVVNACRVAAEPLFIEWP